jgi:hypothetical protein
MGVYLSLQTLGQRLSVSEPCKKGEPIIQLPCLVDDSHLLLVVRNDLNETPHDVGEESNPSYHNEHCRDSFPVADRIEITISNCGKGCQDEVAADNQLPPFILLLEFEIANECQTVILVLLRIEFV